MALDSQFYFAPLGGTSRNYRLDVPLGVEHFGWCSLLFSIVSILQLQTCAVPDISLSYFPDDFVCVPGGHKLSSPSPLSLRPGCLLGARFVMIYLMH